MTTPSEIKKPAVGLLVGGIILAVLALVAAIICSSVLPETNIFMSSDDRLKVGLMRALGLVMVLLLVATSVFAILGAMSMMKGRGYGMAKTGAICAIAGGVFSGLPGWILVLPMGIWALATLRRPATKALLNQDITQPQVPQ